jgi:hypothetical protein
VRPERVHLSVKRQLVQVHVANAEYFTQVHRYVHAKCVVFHVLTLLISVTLYPFYFLPLLLREGVGQRERTLDLVLVAVRLRVGGGERLRDLVGVRVGVADRVRVRLRDSVGVRDGLGGMLRVALGLGEAV